MKPAPVWCKKVGRSHKPVKRRLDWGINPGAHVRCGFSSSIPCYHSMVCSRCGRILVWRLMKTDCPDRTP